MKKKLVILGASEHINPAIIKAKELGFETHVFSWSADEIGEKTADFFYPTSIRKKEEILEKSREIKPQGIISLSSDIAAVTASYIAEELGLTGNGYSTTIAATNKLLSRRIFEKNNIPQPKFFGIGDEMAFPDSKNLSFPVVVKPSDRSGSRGVVKIKSRTELLRSLSEARDISFERKAIVEDYIFGRHYSCECISYKGDHTILTYTKRENIERPSCFIEHFNSQPANLTEKQKKEAESIVLKTLDVLKIKNGASSIEFVIDHNDNVRLIEATPSMYGDFIGTDLVQLSTGFDYLKMIIDIACGGAPDLTKADDIYESVSSQIIIRDEDVKQLNTMIENHDHRLIRYKVDADEPIPFEVSGKRYGYFIYSNKQ